MTALCFDPKTYGSLSTSGEALDRFDQGPGQSVPDTEIRALFERTDSVANLFGIGLLHRHFDMDKDGILVKHSSTSTPWKLPQDPVNFMGGRIVPRSWRFGLGSGNASLQAYEFSFQPNQGDGDGDNVDPTTHQAFIEELYGILEKNDLGSTLGLIAVSPD
ncbi:hypothetical protein QQZ08_005104 [Neonectria magnoliae]|uniref:Uncharacterized protein n=1 Tax=Neonectria magnoliae TaxID=2732573 RepID=A0ABR1I5X3_9HYPO